MDLTALVILMDLTVMRWRVTNLMDLTALMILMNDSEDSENHQLSKHKQFAY